MVLARADAMTATPATVPDELSARLAAAFTPAQRVELAAVIAWENYRSRFNRTFAVAAEGYVEGAVCALPASMQK
jgi:alkylhydroperoxidase family enzyme